jgi:hypothetical protein
MIDVVEFAKSDVPLSALIDKPLGSAAAVEEYMPIQAPRALAVDGLTELVPNPDYDHVQQYIGELRDALESMERTSTEISYIGEASNTELPPG